MWFLFGFLFFFFNDTATTEIYTLSLHDALPISSTTRPEVLHPSAIPVSTIAVVCTSSKDRKSTRLNSSHMSISYAVFCLKKKKKKNTDDKYPVTPIICTVRTQLRRRNPRRQCYLARDAISVLCCMLVTFFFFFLNDPAPPEISPFPLPAALPI